MRVHLSLYDDETSEVCQWHLPEAHFLETWGDARAFDGTVTIQQPLIEPLYDGRSAHQVLQMLDRGAGDERLRDRQGLLGRAAQGRRFRSLVAPRGPRRRRARYGAAAAKTPTLQGAALATPAQTRRLEGKLEVIFRPDPTIYDGRFANNGWLQELPKPITKLTWDNAAILSPATAHRLGVKHGRHAAS